MSFEILFAPVEELDTWLTSLIEGAPLLVALVPALGGFGLFGLWYAGLT